MSIKSLFDIRINNFTEKIIPLERDTHSTASRAPRSYETRWLITFFSPESDTMCYPEPHTCTQHLHIRFLKHYFNIILPSRTFCPKWSLHSFCLIFFDVFYLPPTTYPSHRMLLKWLCHFLHIEVKGSLHILEDLLYVYFSYEYICIWPTVLFFEIY